MAAVKTLAAIFAFLSSFLLLATAFLWFRSQTSLDDFSTYRPRSYRSVWSVEGRFYVFLWSAPEPYWGQSTTSFGGGDLSRMNYSVPIRHRFGPFGYTHMTSTNPAQVVADGTIIMFPHWFVLLLAALAPAIYLRRWLRRRTTEFRAAHGLCLRCGYDMRVSPERCPECGFEKPIPAEERILKV